jgi:hypothetical protein
MPTGSLLNAVTASGARPWPESCSNRDGKGLLEQVGSGCAGRSDLRDLIFFGYQGVPGNDGVTERDFSFLMAALTLRRHILKSRLSVPGTRTRSSGR